MDLILWGPMQLWRCDWESDLRSSAEGEMPVRKLVAFEQYLATVSVG